MFLIQMLPDCILRICILSVLNTHVYEDNQDEHNVWQKI